MISQIAYLDCSAGLTGKLLLAAFIDAGFPLQTLQNTLASLPLSGYNLRVDVVQDKGMRGSVLHISILENQQQTAWQLRDIVALLGHVTLSKRAHGTVLAIFHCLIEAEARIQGVERDVVSVQTPGILEAFIEIIGIALAIETFNLIQLYTSALPLTSGYIQTDQGRMSVPTPITMEILRPVGALWKPCALEGELVTNVGAAVVAVLADFEAPVMMFERIGYGLGQQQLPLLAYLRLCVGRLKSTDFIRKEEADTDWVAVIESHIDNMTGELLGGLMERLFSKGALDVSYTPIQMKKNRPATLLTIICRPADGEYLALLLLRETSTLGVRIQTVQRLKAQRFQEQVATPFGIMLVKVKRLGSRFISASPEYEECQRIAKEQNIPLAEVYEVARQAIQIAILR